MNRKRIGILGSGQLGRMLALAGYPLGFQFHFFDQEENDPIKGLGYFHSNLSSFLENVDVVTYESENIPKSLAESIASQKPLFPKPLSLELSQNRLSEKTLFNRLNIPTPAFQEVSSLEDLHSAIHMLGFPLVLKTTTMGYDGKGQILLKTEEDILSAWQELKEYELIAEEFIHFKRELSIIAVRDQKKNVSFYPLVQNKHHQGILIESLAPAPILSSSDIHSSLTTTAQNMILKLLNHLDHVGVLTLELFETEQGLLANEMAPRVHNSGHWTIEGSHSSQFENHLRAISGLPLGNTETLYPMRMINIIGDLPENISAFLETPGAYLHLYNKVPRPNRKLGHITERIVQ